jgi:nicotinamide mononucleotide transporter
MSYVEFFGTILYLLSAWLIAKKNMLTWPVGIVSVILYLFLFYQIHLYSDALEQLYYLGASFYGWWYWKKNLKKNDEKSVKIRWSERNTILIWIGVTLVGSVILTLIVSRLHEIIPNVFQEAASFPFLDSLTTVMSFTAMFLMAQKRVESWVYWIIVDVIGIVLYFVKDVKLISLLYVALLVIASNGLLSWAKDVKGTEKKRVYHGT